MADDRPATAGPSHEEDFRAGEARLGRDRSAPARTFLAVGLGIVVLATIYWFVSYEDAGTTMLVLAAGFALWAGSYLWLHGRREGTAADAGPPGSEGEPEPYLPHASLWPVGIGAGAFFAFNGLLLGLWFLFPGAVLVVLSLIGWAAQSRHRD